MNGVGTRSTVSGPSCEAVLRGRLALLPACLREVAQRVSASSHARGPVVVTGIGGSEAPARMMAELLRAHAGTSARFVPLSAFTPGAPPLEGAALVVFSQSLSPNARLALERAPAFAHASLFTSVRGGPLRARFEAAGGQVIALPPESEQGTLVRVVGPLAAMLAAALHTGAASPLDVEPLLHAIADAPARLPPVAHRGNIAFVTAGGYGELCHAAKNVWLEALGAREPAMWDVLGVAHGPFQQFFDSETLLVALEREGEERALFDRLERMLVPGRHTLVRLRSSLPRAVAPIDHLAQVIELVCRRLDASPRDLGGGLDSGLDAPLYELGKESPGEG